MDELNDLLELRKKKSDVEAEIAGAQEKIDAAVAELVARRDALNDQIKPMELELREINAKIEALTR